MTVYLFMSTLDQEVFGFTLHSDGANLPLEFAPWEWAGSVSSEAAIAAEVTSGIKLSGFYLMRSSSAITDLSKV